MQWFCSFLTPNLNGLCFHLRVADDSEFHSLPEAFGHMSPHCRFSDLGSFMLRIFSAQVGNRTCTHGDESNPVEISMSSAMKGERGLATGLTTLGAWKSGHRNLCQARIEPGQGPIRFLLLYRGSSPFTHCATSAGEIHSWAQNRYFVTSYRYSLLTTRYWLVTASFGFLH